MEIGRLSGISDAEASDLRSQGIRTVEALEARVALLGLPAAVQGRLAFARTVREALARHALREAEGETRPLALRVLRFPRTNWLDLAVAVLLALAVAGVARAMLRPERSVVAVRDLAAFQVIGPADVEVRSAAADFGVFAAAGDAVGRFPLQVVPAGGALRRDRLSRIRFPRPEELEGRRILSLPVAPHALALARPGTRVAVLLAPGDPAGAPAAAGSLVEDVMVLNAAGAGDTASLVVAVRESALPALGSLGSSRVVVLQQVALPPAESAEERRAAAPSQAPGRGSGPP